MDLLTAVLHELGHVLGLEDLDPLAHAGDLMAAALTPGTRRLPASSPVPVTDYVADAPSQLSEPGSPASAVGSAGASLARALPAREFDLVFALLSDPSLQGLLTGRRRPGFAR